MDSSVEIIETPLQSSPSSCSRYTSASCCWKLLHFFNTFAVAILCAVVTFLVIQLQYVNYTLKQEQDRINDLLQEVQNQQHDQIQQLSVQVEKEHSLTIYQMAGTFTLLVALITIFHMSSHLRGYRQPIVQRRILAILWMSPIYSTTSFFSLVFPSANGYLSVLRDFYEAYIIYTFLAFLIAVLGKGDRSQAIRVLARRADHLKPPTRCFGALYNNNLPETINGITYYNDDYADNNNAEDDDEDGNVTTSTAASSTATDRAKSTVSTPPHTSNNKVTSKISSGNNTNSNNARNSLVSHDDANHVQNNQQNAYAAAAAYHKAHAVMTECQVLALQFVLVRPVTSLANFIASAIEASNQGDRIGDDVHQSSPLQYFISVHFALDILTNISVFFAFTGLLRFYHAVQEDLQWCSPFYKFMAIKGIVFLTFWQGLLITIVVHLQWSERETNTETSYINTSVVAGTSTSTSSETWNNATRLLDVIATVASNATSSGSSNSGISSNDGKVTMTSVSSSSPSSTKTAQEQASEIQNVLICLEMLLFSIAHWCVFPAEEWEDNYRPRKFAKPSMGLRDFASDVGMLTSNFTNARKHRRRHRRQHQYHRQRLTSQESSNGSDSLFVIDDDEDDDNSDSLTAADDLTNCGLEVDVGTANDDDDDDFSGCLDSSDRSMSPTADLEHQPTLSSSRSNDSGVPVIRLSHHHTLS